MKLTSIIFTAAALVLTSCGAADNQSNLSGAQQNSPSEGAFVNDTRSESIVNAFSATEVTKNQIGGGYTIAVKDLKCSSIPSGFIPYECSFVDVVFKKTIHVLDESAGAIVTSLKDAGAKSVTNRAGEVQGFTLKAKTIGCSRGGFVGIDSCSFNQ